MEFLTFSKNSFQQKVIKVTLEVPKTGRYHVVFNYALNHSQPVKGEIELSPRGQGVKQSSPVTFPSTQVGSTYVDGFATAGQRGQPSQFMLTKGTWDLTFMAPPSKLIVVSYFQDSIYKVDPHKYHCIPRLQGGQRIVGSKGMIFSLHQSVKAFPG
jgi:hypothetical protein